MPHGEAEQLRFVFPGQSLLLVWPQIVVLFALMVGCFALAYARFMRQEVRA